MIIAGYEYPGNKPFSNIYLTGIVRDKQRRKMSKSLGNSPDPLDLIDEYSADGVRVGMLFCSPAGGDLLYDNSLPEQGRNFTNKIWNAFRLVKNWKVDENIEQPEHAKIAIDWFESKLNDTISQINQQFENFRLSDVLMTVYKFFWDDFSAWYLEIIKPEYQKPIDSKTYEQTLWFFKNTALLLSPFMPFITEEIWQFLRNDNDVKSIVIAKWPKIGNINKNLISEFENCQQVVANIRTIRQEKNIPQKNKLDLFIIKHENCSSVFDSVSKKLGNLENITYTEEKISTAVSFLVKTNEYSIPVGNLVNKEEELEKLGEELKYTEGFLNSVLKKLSNDRFVNNAPANVIEIERKKQSDAEAKIKILKEQIEGLK
jgi:valyl-tRNA synthetase